MLGSMLGGSEAIPALSATERSTIRIKRPPPCACRVDWSGFRQRTALYATGSTIAAGIPPKRGVALPRSPALAYARRQRRNVRLRKGGILGIGRRKNMHRYRRRREPRL